MSFVPSEIFSLRRVCGMTFPLLSVTFPRTNHQPSRPNTHPTGPISSIRWTGIVSQACLSFYLPQPCCEFRVSPIRFHGSQGNHASISCRPAVATHATPRVCRMERGGTCCACLGRRRWMEAGTPINLTRGTWFLNLALVLLLLPLVEEYQNIL